MSRHVAGPWRVGENLNNKMAVASGNTVICVIPTLGFSEEINRANAQLIAAAPELLEALKREPRVHIIIAADIDWPKHDQEECEVCQLIKRCKS